MCKNLPKNKETQKMNAMWTKKAWQTVERSHLFIFAYDLNKSLCNHQLIHSWHEFLLIMFPLYPKRRLNLWHFTLYLCSMIKASHRLWPKIIRSIESLMSWLKKNMNRSADIAAIQISQIQRDENGYHFPIKFRIYDERNLFVRLHYTHRCRSDYYDFLSFLPRTKKN